MANLDFPANPTLGQTHSVGNKTWQWNGVAWAVQRVSVPGKSAYEIAIEKGFVGTEAAWTASLKGAKGDQGIQGPIGLTGDRGTKGDKGDNGIDGINGTNGTNGAGVPLGGTAGMVLTKNSNDPYDTSWLAPDYLSDYTVPLGGNSGQYLGKNSAGDGDFAWKDLPVGDAGSPELPLGGNQGQVLTKNSTASGDVKWADPTGGAGVPDGGTTGQVLAKNSEFNGDATWHDPVGGIEEAPLDANGYVRKNGAWAVETGGTGGSFPEAPTDGKQYVRKDGAWVEVVASASVDVPYIIPAFTAYPPEQSETLIDHIFVTPVTFAANFAGSQGSVGTNPANAYVLTLQNNGVNVGSISIATNGVTTFTTANGADLEFVPGDLLSIICPAQADLSIARIRITLLGTRN